jgi:hypothetical protein
VEEETSMHSFKDSGQSCAKALAFGVMLMAASTAMGASEGSATDWQYGLEIYGWFPSVSGDLLYGPQGSSGDIDVDANRIIDALQMTFMGSFEVRKGAWSGFTDVIYLKLAGDKSKSVSVPDGAVRTLFDADMDLKSWVWTLGGSYTVWRNQKSHLDLLAGARLLSLDTGVKLTGGGPLQRDRKLSESVNLWDGVVGAKGRIALNDRWFLPYYADVGPGDSELTWQAEAGVGYAFDWGDVNLMYRYLAYDQGSDKLLQSIGLGGVKLGVGFRF